MFRLNYIIVHKPYDDFYGVEGFYEIAVNDKTYGDLYSKEIRAQLTPEHLYAMMHNLVKVAIILSVERKVYLSDKEAHQLWLKFVKNREKLKISLINSRKGYGEGDIELNLKYGEENAGWYDQEVDLKQFTDEIINKAHLFADEMSAAEGSEKSDNLRKLITKLKNIQS